MPDTETSLPNAALKIRAAWRKGDRTITIDDVKLTIKKQTKRITLTLQDGTHVKKIEHWLVARPADKHRFVPVYSVEMEVGKNSRTTMKTAKEDQKLKPPVRQSIRTKRS